MHHSTQAMPQIFVRPVAVVKVVDVILRMGRACSWRNKASVVRVGTILIANAGAVSSIGRVESLTAFALSNVSRIANVKRVVAWM